MGKQLVAALAVLLAFAAGVVVLAAAVLALQRVRQCSPDSRHTPVTTICSGQCDEKRGLYATTHYM